MTHTDQAQDLIVVYVTNKGMYGEKTNGHYASGYIPAGLAARHPGKVYVVDIDDPNNKAFLLGDQKAPLTAFPVDREYHVADFDAYKTQSIPFGADYRERVAMVIPYTSSESDPEILTHMKAAYPTNVLYTNDPDGMAKFNSKAALIDIREDVGAADFNTHINPQILIRTPQEYRAFKEQYPEHVLRSTRSTEGAGVYIHAPQFFNGRTELVDGYTPPKQGQHQIAWLLNAEKEVLGTPYVDTAKTGDLRVYALYDEERGPIVIKEGILRHAPKKGTADNPCPKCNISSGGSYEIVEVTQAQQHIARQTISYLYKKAGLRIVGLDFFDQTLSEINNSADGWNYVQHHAHNGIDVLIGVLDGCYQQALAGQKALSKSNQSKADQTKIKQIQK